MKLPSITKKIDGLSIDSTEWSSGDTGITFIHYLDIHYSNGDTVKWPLLEFIDKYNVEEMATELGLVKFATKQTDYHKVCKNGHRKPYAGECQVCLYLWHEKQKKARKAKA